MSTFFGSVWWLLVTLGVLVTFHEFGHFVVARRCGVKVLRFSVGFGRALWSHVARDGTEYRIAMIPLGGYVKMLDAREGEVDPALRDREFTGKPLAQRFAIVAAGPAFNIVFTLLAFWLMFMIGRPDSPPVVGAPPPQTLAAEAGLHAGDRVVKVGTTTVSTWTGMYDALTGDMFSHHPVTLTVHTPKGGSRVLTLPLNRLPHDVDLGSASNHLGLVQPAPPAIVGRVLGGDPAARAGLRKGDRITAVGNTKVDNFIELGKAIRTQASKSPRLTLSVQRGGRSLTVPVTAKWSVLEGNPKASWGIGIGPQPPPTAILRYGPLHAAGASLTKAWNETATTFTMIGRMLTGQASTRNIGGPILIARAADVSASMGLGWFLGFLGLVSLSLAILNLLPIPVLDGGHLLYYLVELVKGRPVSERAMITGQFVGMALLATLMGLVFYNDILRLVS